MIKNAAKEFYNSEAKYMGEGGSIPLMNEFQAIYPKV